MRKFSLFILLVGLLGSWAWVHAQDTTAQPVYSVIYPTDFAGTRYATYYSDDTWQFGEIRARPVYGDVGGQLALPFWSADGQAVYMSVYKPNSDELATSIYGYYFTSNAVAPLADIFDAEAEGFKREMVILESISPDSQYVWVRRVFNPQTSLLNLKTQQIVAVTDCPARVLAWIEGEVIASCTGENFAEPKIFALRLANGEQTRLLLPPPPNSADPFSVYPQQGRVLKGGRLMVGAFDSETPAIIGVLSMEDYSATYFEKGNYLQLNADQTYATYYVEGRLKRLNLETLKVTDLGAALPTEASLWSGDTVSFWRAIEANHEFTLLNIRTDLRERTERIFYQGLKPTRWIVSSQSEVVVLGFQNGGSASVDIYTFEGDLLWSSAEEYPNSYITLPAPQNMPIAWSQDGTWLHLEQIPAVGLPLQTLSINLKEGYSLTAVEDRAVYLGESPDGKWWLFALSSDPNNLLIRDRLITYDPVRDWVIPIIPNGISLYTNFAHPDWSYFVWSPMQEN